MKTYGLHLKNIAAFVMMLALLSLLLPFCKITTPANSASVSGIGLIQMGASVGYEHYRNGQVEDDYVLQGNLTWGEVKSGVNYAIENDNLRKAEVIGVISILPILFCFLAMIFTLMAVGKKTMVLPTLFLTIALVENIILISKFGAFQKILFSSAGADTIKLSLLMGIYAFTILCGIALAILLFLWITGGFDKPDSDDDKKNGKDDDTKREKKRRRPKREKRRKKKGRKEKKKRKKKKNSDDSDDDSDENNKDLKLDKVTGISGIYEYVDMNALQGKDGTYSIGTEPDKLSGENCFTVKYDRSTKHFDILSKTDKNIFIKTPNGKLYCLDNGNSMSVEKDAFLYVGESNNVIRLG